MRPLVGLALFLLVVGVTVPAVATLVGGVPGIVLALVGTLAVAAVVAWRAGSGESGDGSDSESGSDSVWGLIPEWQYDGRHVESGGHTRAEQERAIEEVRERAERDHPNR